LTRAALSLTRTALTRTADCRGSTSGSGREAAHPRSPKKKLTGDVRLAGSLPSRSLDGVLSRWTAGRVGVVGCSAHYFLESY
jgi:hypothetical protein